MRPEILLALILALRACGPASNSGTPSRVSPLASDNAPVIRPYEASRSFQAHTHQIYSPEMSPVDDALLLSTGSDDIPGLLDQGTVRLWDLNRQAAAWERPHKSMVLSATFSPDGTLVAYGADKKVHVV